MNTSLPLLFPTQVFVGTYARPQSRLHRCNLGATAWFPLRSADSCCQALLLLYLQFSYWATIPSFKVSIGPHGLNPGASQGYRKSSTQDSLLLCVLLPRKQSRPCAGVGICFGRNQWWAISSISGQWRPQPGSRVMGTKGDRLLGRSNNLHMKSLLKWGKPAFLVVRWSFKTGFQSLEEFLWVDYLFPRPMASFVKTKTLSLVGVGDGEFLQTWLWPTEC